MSILTMLKETIIAEAGTSWLSGKYFAIIEYADAVANAPPMPEN